MVTLMVVTPRAESLVVICYDLNLIFVELV